jgi:hypothetical protein
MADTSAVVTGVMTHFASVLFAPFARLVPQVSLHYSFIYKLKLERVG